MTEENKYLDKLFASKFAGFEAEPPAHVWKNIHTELHGKGGGSINPVTLASLAALVLISGLLGFSIIKDIPYATHNSNELYTQVIAFADVDMSTEAYQEPATSAPEYTPPAQPASSNNSQPSTISIPDPAKEEAIPAGNTSHSNIHERYAETTYSSAFYEEAHLAKLKARRSFSAHASVKPLNTASIVVRDSKYEPRFSDGNKGERKYSRKAEWQIGLLFTPEIIIYPEDSIPNQTAYTLEVSTKWIKNEFFLESGLGVSFSSDDGLYAIDYEKYLGSYDDVYNVTFDTSNGNVTPIYHTNLTNVYDSISKYKVEQTRNQYTYLQIPLYVGFNKQVERFGWFVKAGPIFSVLVNSKIPTPDVGNDKIIGIDQEMPSRVNTNWQLAISAGLNYQLSDNISLAIEPTFRYFLNSQYERKYITSPHPYGFGLRTGLLFNF